MLVDFCNLPLAATNCLRRRLPCAIFHHVDLEQVDNDNVSGPAFAYAGLFSFRCVRRCVARKFSRFQVSGASGGLSPFKRDRGSAAIHASTSVESHMLLPPTTRERGNVFARIIDQMVG